jgi:hypothetical protein
MKIKPGGFLDILIPGSHEQTLQAQGNVGATCRNTGGTLIFKPNQRSINWIRLITRFFITIGRRQGNAPAVVWDFVLLPKDVNFVFFHACLAGLFYG